MPADLSMGEIAFFAVIGVGVVIGLFRGLSGGLGTVGGLAAAIAAGWAVLDPIAAFISGRNWFQDALAIRAVSLVADGIIGLVVFGVVRRLIEKFVRFLVPRTLDSVLGGVAGAAAAFALWRAGEWLVAFYRGGGVV